MTESNPLGGKLSKALMLRRTYSNWVSLLLHSSPEKSIRLVLRDGRSIQLQDSTRETVIDSSVFLAQLLQNHWTVKGIDDRHVTMCDESGTSVKCRISDLAGELLRLREIFVDMVYGEEFAGRVVVDVGMCNGDSSIFFAKRGARMVVGLEPFPDSFELARQNIELNGLGRTILPLSFALAGTSRDDYLVLEPTSTGHNWLLAKDDGERSEVNRTMPVRTISITDLVSTMNLSSIDVLKIDCEGGEYEIIEALPETIAKTIGKIILEYHRGPRDIPDRLTSFGFQVEVNGTQLRGGYLVATSKRRA